jgi:putative transcriptional regulator
MQVALSKEESPVRNRWTLVLCLLLTSGAQDSTNSRKGELLVATSSIPDPRFAETVILIIEDNDEGTLGLVVNRPAGRVERSDVYAQLGIEGEASGEAITVFEGGPVFPDQLFALHSSEVRLPGTRDIAPGIAVTEATEVMTQVGAGKGPKDLMLILGYSGWGKGQLDAEMTTGSWMLVPSRPGLVFSPEPAKTWRRIMDEFTMRM